MARGSESKEKITNQILATFEGSFKYDKEIRIPIMENGELVQIKVTLTAAKTNVDMGGDVAIPGQDLVTGMKQTVAGEVSKVKTASIEVTEEEKANVRNLMQSLGF